MDLRRYSVLGALLFCMTALAMPSTADAARGKKKAKAESSEQASESSSDTGSEGDDTKAEGDAEPAEEPVEEPDAWERPPVEEEAPPEAAPAPPKEEPHGDGRHLSLGLLIGYGFEHDGTFGSNPYGLGFGLRGGYTLDFGLYVGGTFSYFLGTSDEGNSGGGSGTTGGAIEQSSNYMQILAEVGYDIWISKLVIRPYMGMGVGMAFLDSTGTAALYASPVSSFSFAPGASIFYNIDSVFIGGDVRFNIMGGNGVTGTVLSAFGGMRF
jgi:hypothetical protein